MIKSTKPWILYYLVCAVTGLILGIWAASRLVGSVGEPGSTYPPTASLLPPRPITLLFVGDVMLGRSVYKNIVASNDPTWPFHYVADRLKAADITYVNLEGPLTDNCPVVETGMIFCGDTANVAGLVASGVDVASLANNHATNYGPDGLTATVTTLKEHGIEPVGVGSAVRLTREGQIFTFLSFNDIGPYPDIDNVDTHSLTGKIEQAKIPGEILVVTFHWGHEYTATPSARQISLAHQAIEAGADLVIGAHPHWVQTSEIYQGKPIYYSLGNFVFDQEWSLETKRGLVVEFSYLNGQLVGTNELPVVIENYGQPRFE